MTGDTTIAELADAWLATILLDPRKREQTRKAYRDSLRATVNPLFGSLTLSKATTGILDRKLTDLAASAPTRAKRARTVLSQMFGLAVRRDAVSANPVLSTSPVRMDRKEPEALSVVDVRRVREGLEAWAYEHALHPDENAAALVIRDVIDVILGTSARINVNRPGFCSVL